MKNSKLQILGKTLTLILLFFGISARSQSFVLNSQQLLYSWKILFSNQSDLNLTLPVLELNPRISVELDLDLNSPTNTVIFERISIDVEGSMGFSHVWDVSGSPVRIKGAIVFDYTLDFFSNEATPMTVGTDQFHIADSDFNRNLDKTDDNQVKGTYHFFGPTESVSGTFAVHPPFWHRIAGQGLSISTNNFPQQITLGANNDRLAMQIWMPARNNTPNWQDAVALLSETVDGVDLEFTLAYSTFGTQNHLEFSEVIPEPSYFLAASLILTGFIAFRRMRIFHKRQL